MRVEAWPIGNQIVTADEIQHSTDRLLLLREGRIVFQARTSDVAHIEPHENLRAAKLALEERLAIRGRGGLHVQELTTPSGPGSTDTRVRGGPAEAIGLRIEER